MFARLNETPYWAGLAVGLVIAGLVLIGDVKTTWSFSAFTVLIYYALINLAALRLPKEQRLAPIWVSGLGLAVCLFLASWVEQQTWLIGLGLVLAGLLWHAAVSANRAILRLDGWLVFRFPAHVHSVSEILIEVLGRDPTLAYPFYKPSVGWITGIKGQHSEHNAQHPSATITPDDAFGLVSPVKFVGSAKDVRQPSAF